MYFVVVVQSASWYTCWKRITDLINLRGPSGENGFPENFQGLKGKWELIMLKWNIVCLGQDPLFRYRKTLWNTTMNVICIKSPCDNYFNNIARYNMTATATLPALSSESIGVLLCRQEDITLCTLPPSPPSTLRRCSLRASTSIPLTC